MDPILLTVLLGAVIGLVLALTGAGGGVLAIPLLVFALHLNVQQAAPVGLLAVGVSALVGAGLGLRQGIVRYRAALLIGLTGMLVAPLGVVLAQRLPNRPLLAAFSLLLIFVAWRTLTRARATASGAETDALDAQGGELAAGSASETLGQANEPAAPCHVKSSDGRLDWTLPCARSLGLTGVVSGLLSGMLGVGGGFVIIPALSRYTDLELHSIQATSLAVIALVSASAVGASALHGSIPWNVALPFTAGSVLALLAGRPFARRLDRGVLQAIFAWLTVLVAVLLLARAAGWSPA